MYIEAWVETWLTDQTENRVEVLTDLTTNTESSAYWQSFQQASIPYFPNGALGKPQAPYFLKSFIEDYALSTMRHGTMEVGIRTNGRIAVQKDGLGFAIEVKSLPRLIHYLQTIQQTYHEYRYQKRLAQYQRCESGTDDAEYHACPFTCRSHIESTVNAIHNLLGQQVHAADILEMMETNHIDAFNETPEAIASVIGKAIQGNP